MRLDPAEFAELPLQAALLDQQRRPVVWTPEWQGWAPGATVYFAGHGHLMVGGEAASPVLRSLLTELLAALEQLRGVLGDDEAARLQVLIAGLRVVAGEPLEETDRGTSDDVLRLTKLAAETRVVPPVAIGAAPTIPPLEVPAPAVVALALLQLIVNVSRHEWEDLAQTRPVLAVRLRTAAGPSFLVEWRSERRVPGQVRTHRHVERRSRWGAGYVRLAADALGGTALPPAPRGDGTASVGFGLGGRNLALPLCCEEAGRPPRTTRAWDQEHDPSDPTTAADREAQEQVRAAALAEPGRLVAGGYHTARAVPGTGRIWSAMPPETGDARVRDALLGLDHEQALLRAPEPHASTLHALNVLLRAGLDDGAAVTTSYRQDWLRRFPPAMRAAGLAVPVVRDAAVYPDPLLAAWLLRGYGGRLDVDATGSVWYRPARPVDERLRLLRPAPDGSILLARGLAF